MTGAEAVHVEGDSATTPDRFALTVRNAGFDGIVFRNDQSDPAAIDPAAIEARYGLEVYSGYEITATDRSTASGAIGNRRPEADVLILEGRDPTLNRFAVESPRVDVLGDPMGGDGDVNHVIAATAAANDVAIEVSLARVLRREGAARERAVKRLIKLRELIDDADAPFVVSASPRSHLEVRGPRELIAVGNQIGLSSEAVRAGLSTWLQIGRRNRRRHDPSWIGSGVRRRDFDDGSS
ncbi:MAG: RNase P subunit p30 family protein [Halodesulfurarchaeum sp.]